MGNILREATRDNQDNDIAEIVQKMWTSTIELDGTELCSILNEALREDRRRGIYGLVHFARAINQLCVSVPPSPPFPPNNVCFRGGGFNNEYRGFFVSKRKFRQPAFLATSFSLDIASGFIERSAEFSKVLWSVHIDPAEKCHHVNLVRNSVADHEQEYLFAPYSTFSVIRSTWTSGTVSDPHRIVLLAAVDNKNEPEDLPLAPWT